MSVNQLVVLVLYVFDVSLCLIAIHKKNSGLYIATKPLLMPLLCTLYFVLLPSSARGFWYQKYVIIALGFHTLGDICLLFPRGKSKKMFFLGMLSFFSGHVFYSMWFINAPVKHSNDAAILGAILCFVTEYLIYRQLMLGPRRYAPVMVPYSFGLCMLAISIASTAGSGSPLYATLISFLGIMLFCFSDFCIMRRTVRLPLFGQMVVMTTYIGGQSLIVLGMLLMQW